jgi:BRCA1-associated protein
MFIKFITFETPTKSTEETSFPDMSHDPFTPALADTTPTTSLACPVCLERMDDTTGLLTIPCQHVFHCACLQKWRGSGCPVCRHIQPSSDRALSTPFAAGASDLCTVCDCTEDLWICLICGNNGCGRYKGGHAKEHWTESGHNYALEIETQHVWDYASDGWVHRLIQTKGDGKLVELPSDSRPNGFGSDVGQHHSQGQEDMVPAAKLERSADEFAHLLTSQLDSQRVYFEAMVKNSADKASASAKAADAAAVRAEAAISQLSALTIEFRKLQGEIVPSLERERDRMAAKAEKTAEIARKMTQSFQEEKQVGKGLMQRIEHVNTEMAKISNEVKKLKDENEELKEYNRDLQAYFSAGEKLKGLEGTELGDEIKEGNAIAGAAKGEARKKGKGKK